MLTVTLFDVINFFSAYRTIVYIPSYIYFINNIFRLITLHILNKLYPLSYYHYYIYAAAQHLGGCRRSHTTTVRLIIIII